jgi:hypothetical protein
MLQKQFATRKFLRLIRYTRGLSVFPVQAVLILNGWIRFQGGSLDDVLDESVKYD